MAGSRERASHVPAPHGVAAVGAFDRGVAEQLLPLVHDHEQAGPSLRLEVSGTTWMKRR